MKSLFIFILLTLMVFTISLDAKDCPIQFHCNNTSKIDSPIVEEFCQDHYNVKMDSRCCIFNNTILGLDLRHCEIMHLNISQPEFSNVKILDLRNNNFQPKSSPELPGFLDLNYLYLPENIPCPGGKNGWNLTLMGKDMTSCIIQLDFCISLNISCGDPTNAKCHHIGPGMAKCKCCPGHFGYKCMTDDEFPVGVFLTSVIIPTVVLSVVLWFVQGRDPYRKFQT